MEFDRYKIAGGNTTLLVEGFDGKNGAEFSNKAIEGYLAEQVGFVKSGKEPALNMMGDELCINATLAFAKRLGDSGKLRTSGTCSPIKYWNNGETGIRLPLRFQIEDPPARLGVLGKVVKFNGIGYLCTSELGSPRVDLIRDLCEEYNLPAFGLAMYSGNNLVLPLVYVKGSDTVVAETSCGSASIALNLVTGGTAINQPSGKDRILVTRNRITLAADGSSEAEFTVAAKVVKISENKAVRETIERLVA